MALPFPGIGIIFDIGALGGGHYGSAAWRIFMKAVSPQQLAGCFLVEGDTALTLYEDANEFCIGVYSPRADLSPIRETFEVLDEPGLVPMPRRIMEKPALDVQPLPDRGRVDSFGRLITEDWMRFVHDLCKECGWGYAPENTPQDLPANLKAELDALRRPLL